MTASLGVAAVIGGAVVPLATAPAAHATTWPVRPGDTLGAIAAHTGATVPALARANGLRDPGRLAVGQVLTVPGRAPAAPRAASAAAAQPVATSFAGRTHAAGTTSAATANRHALTARPQPGEDAVRRMVADTARAMGVDPALALAVAHQESGLDASVVSPANAVGVMQVIPSSGAWASTMVGRHLDLLDTRDDVVAGVAILRSLQAAAADTPTAIAGYYQGLAGLVRRGMYADTRRYVANVQTLMARFA